MKYKYLSDSHTHSKCSFDGNDSVAMMCEKATNMGMYSLTVTDHCECNDYFKENLRESVFSSVIEIIKARALYNSRLRVYIGIELGQPNQDIDACRDALSLTDYDFVLGSLHNLKGEKDFYYLDYTPETVPSLLERYFDEMLDIVKMNNFDSLAHMTYPLRYICVKPGCKVNLKNYSEKIDEILELLIKNQKAIEINTSGLRQKIGKILPDESVIKRFRELGGKYVTLGSDAHRWGDIGSGIETGLDILNKCGFTHFTVFEKREPHLLPIL